jgi:predicted lipoprotein
LAALKAALFMSRIAIIIGIVLLGAALLWRYPLFHVVRLEQSTTPQQASAFNARDFAEDYWQDRLIPRLSEAHDAATVLAALDANAQQARSQFGRTVGLGRSSYFLIRGEGTIVSIEKNRVAVALSANATDPDLLINAGPVFGNAVRDAPGLLKAGDFTHSQHFNELAAELNLLVENRVGKPLAKQARVGRKVRFVGCIEVRGEKPTRPLKLIPLEAAVE